MKDEGREVKPDEVEKMRTVKGPARRGTVTSAQARAAIRAVNERQKKAVDDDFTEEEWPGAAASNPAFAFLDRPEEDVYGPEDGEPHRDEPGPPEE